MSDIVERLRACPGVAYAADPECNCAEAAAEIERLRNSLPMQTIADQQTKITEAAAFLDGLAGRLDDLDVYEPATAGPNLDKEAADCRAMAAKLRGERWP
jgi:hypothetical protein